MMRAPGAASTSIATMLSAIDVVEIEVRGAAWCGCARAAPPSASSTVSREAPKPRSASSARQRRRRRRRRRSAPGCARRDADAGGCSSSARPCSESSVDLGQRPAEPRRGQAEGRRRRARTSISSGATWRASIGADAVEERIARGEHADLAGRAAPSTSSTRVVERARPGPRRRRGSAAPASARWRSPPNTISALAIRPRATGAQARRRRPRRCRRWTASARDAAGSGASGLSGDMRHILILGGTTRSAAAGASSLAGRADLDVTLSLAGRTADPARAAGAGADRRLRRRRGARGLSRATSASTC